jgi:signal transduction histidine kinase
MSFRTKIALWYGAIVLATLVAFRVASVGVIREMLEDEFDDSLRAEARWVERLIGDYRARGIPDREIVTEIAERSRLAPRKEFIEVRDPTGRVVFRSPNLESASLYDLARPPLGEPSDARLRDVPVRVLVADAPGLQVAVGYPLTDLEVALDNLVQSFLYLIPLAILLAGAGGFFLAARFLRPLVEMERYADDVVALPLDQPLPSPPAAPGDEIGRLLGRIHDLVRRLRENLRRAIAFSSLASHELRTPLSVLRVQMEGAMHPDAGVDELQDALGEAYDEILRLSSVVARLLDMSTLQAGTFRLDLEPVDLGPFLESFADDVRPLCESRSASIRTARRADPKVLADPSRLRQVLLNLLDNALRHVPEGGHVSLGLDVEDDWAVLRVSDDGPGIPADRLERIFDPFYSAHERGRRGAGLGLAFVRWIVEEHGGEVTTESVEGAGTSITLRLPRDGSVPGRRAATP